MLFAALAATLLPAYAAANVFSVQVAEGGSLSFSPSNLNVSNGDIVQFVFNTAGHTVTQSTLANPCTALEGGFSSGFSTSAGEVWNLTVTDTSKPIWYFCAQTTPAIHCEKGMVGAFNSPSNTFDSFAASASAATNTPSGSVVALSGSGAAATASITSASAVSANVPAGTSSGTATGTSPPSQSSGAAKPFAGFEGIGATVLAFFGAFLL